MADNLITAVQIRKLLDVEIHPDFRTYGAQGLLVNLVQNIFHTLEKEVCFLNTHKISLPQSHQEGPFQDVCGGLNSKRSQIN